MMQQQIENIYNDNERLYFTLKGVNVSVVNSIRRTILSNIDTLVFRGFPHEENQINILKNTTKFNNEYLKQRISCIPIINPDEKNYENFIQNYQIMIKEENNTSEQMDITTKHIQLMNKNTNKVESVEIVKKYFPPDPISGDYIVICVLYPNYNKANEQNERLQFIAEFDRGNAGENACWNVAHHCSYECRRNEAKINEMASKIDDPMQKNDFIILDAQRIVYENEYIMSVESIGIFSNEELVYKACEYILKCLKTMFANLKSKQSEPIVSYDQNVTHITSSNGALQQSIQNSIDGYFTLYKEDEFYVFKLKEDDYTMGKLVETYFFEMYENDIQFVGFKKKHPTEKEAYIYIKFKTNINHEEVYKKMLYLLDILARMFLDIQQKFAKLS